MICNIYVSVLCFFYFRNCLNNYINFYSEIAKNNTLEIYQNNHIVALQKIITEHQFDNIKWTNYFIDQCENEKNLHKGSISVLSLLSFFITASSCIIANRSFGGWEQLSKKEQWSAVMFFCKRGLGSKVFEH